MILIISVAMFLLGVLCLALPVAAYKTPPPPLPRPTPTTPFFSIEGFPNVPRCGYKSCHSSSCNKEPPDRVVAASRMLCFCDSSCILFGDCCHDYFEVCLNTSMSRAQGPESKGIQLNASNVGMSWRSQSELLRHRMCMMLAEQHLYWVIARCPEDSKESVYVENCEQTNRTVFGRIPVTLKENPVITFANIHCAMCHGLNSNQVRFWKAKASYTAFNNETRNMSFQSISRYVMTSRLTLTQTPNDKPRPCLPHLYPVPSMLTESNFNSSTNENGSQTHQLCLMYSYPVTDSNYYTYRNPHCAINVLNFEHVLKPLHCLLMHGSAHFSASLSSGGGFSGSTAYPVSTPYQIGNTWLPLYAGTTPYQVGFTPYPGPTKYPIGFIPSPGATPYIDPTPYPVGFTPFPGATPYPGPTKYPIGFTPSPGATPYLGPTPYPIGYTPYPKATPYPGPTVITASHNVPHVVSLDILFNFGEHEMSFQVGEEKFTDVTYCPQDEVYVTYSGRCEKLICHDKDTRPVNGSCVLLDKLVMNGTQQIFPQGAIMFVTDIRVAGRKQRTSEQQIKYLFGKSLQTKLRKISTTDFNIGLKTFEKNCKSGMSNESVRSTTSNESLPFQYQMNNSGYLLCEYKLRFEANIQSTDYINNTINAFHVLTMKMKHSKMNVLDFVVSNFQLDNHRPLQSYSESLVNITCPEGTIAEMHLGAHIVVADKIYYAKIGREYFGLDNILFQISFKTDTSIFKLADIVICNTTEDNGTLHCPNGLVSILASTFKLGPDNDTIILTNGDGILQSDNFTLTDDGALVCNIFTSAMPQVRFFDYNQIQSILTILSSSVSIFSLFFLIIVYLSLPELRNVPGKIVMCLSSTLLLAQTFQLLIKIPTGWMCVAVASLSHVTWLSTFMWTTILSVDLARSLRSMAPLPGSQNHRKLFCLYSVIAWVLPSLFVMACVLVDHFNVFNIVIGYSSEGLCWIDNPMASLYVFGIPVVLTLAVNMFCFTLTVFGIERTAKLMLNKSKICKNEKTRLGIYIRLTFIMGFTWISCFAAAFVKVSIIWYFQIVLNGLQGFYIFLCFVCKSRIMRLIVQKYHLKLFKKQAKDNPSMTMTTSS